MLKVRPVPIATSAAPAITCIGVLTATTTAYAVGFSHTPFSSPNPAATAIILRYGT